MNPDNPDVKPVAEPSAATPVQYDDWDEHGTPIVAKKSTPSKQNSAPAASEETPEKPVIAAESGAAPQKQETKDKLSANERIRQLNAEKKALEERLRTLESAPQPTAKPQQSAQPSNTLERPKRPKMAEFDGTQGKTLDDYETALDKYNEELSRFIATEAVAKDRASQAQAIADQRANQQLSEARTKYSDFDTVSKPLLEQVWSDPKVDPAVKTAIAASPVMTDLIYAIGGHQETLSALAELSRINPIEAIKRLGAIESLVIAELQKTAKPAKPNAAEPDTPVPPKPRAPKPVSEVGGRASSDVDPSVAAAKANDFSAFEAEQNRRAFASRR